MKKAIFVLFLVLVLLSTVCSVVLADSVPLQSTLMPRNSKYVGEADLVVRYYEDAETTRPPLYFTAWNVFWGGGCFTDGTNTVKVTELFNKEGYQWTVDGNVYCLVKK